MDVMVDERANCVAVYSGEKQPCLLGITSNPCCVHYAEWEDSDSRDKHILRAHRFASRINAAKKARVDVLNEAIAALRADRGDHSSVFWSVGILEQLLAS